QVVWPAVGEELLHRQVHLVRWLVWQDADLEVADVGIAQDPVQRLGIAVGSAKPAQPRVGVAVVGDDQGTASAVHRSLTGPCGGAATRRSGAAVPLTTPRSAPGRRRRARA